MVGYVRPGFLHVHRNVSLAASYNPTPQAAAAAGSLAVAAPVFAESKDSLTLAGKGGMTGTRAAYQDVCCQPSAPATTHPPGKYRNLK